MEGSPPGQRASEKAAREVEVVIAAAERAARELEAEGRRNADALRREAAEAAEAITRRATADAQAERTKAERESRAQLEEARKQAARLDERSTADAAERVTAAQRAADEVLAEATAVSAGLRHLGETLEEQAARMLGEVRAAHRRMTNDLRVSGAQPAVPPARGGARPPQARPRERVPRSGSTSKLDVPPWIDRSS